MKMINKTRTFVDANILINATNINDAVLIMKIENLLDSEQREFVASDFLELEVLPKPVHNKRQVSVEFCQNFFASCVERIEVNSRTTKIAYDEACLLGLSGADAIHLAAAYEANADELVTLEKPTKPMYKSKLVKVVYLHDIK